ncbi:hypothetical protein JL720_16872 [Aureococcus anophagefferens]|nr:hypothetical protein JL720_16872 [Aureococcus anophagefferens]
MEYAAIPDEEAGPSGVDAAPTKRRLGVAGLLVAAAACVGLPAARSAASAALYAAFDGAPPDDGGSVTLAPTTKAENAAKAAACADCDCFRNVWYVDSAVDVDGPTGFCWASAFAHLGTALDAASYGDEIWVAHGVYAPLGGSRNATFRMREGVEVSAASAATRARAERDYAAYRTVLTGDLGGAAEAVEDDDDTILNGGARGQRRRLP